MYATGFPIANIKTPLPIKDGKLLTSNGHSPSCSAPRKAWNSLSGEAKALSRKLASDQARSMGARDRQML